MAKEKYQINEVAAKRRTHAVTVINGRRVNLLAEKAEVIDVPESKKGPASKVTIHPPTQADLKYYHDQAEKGGGRNKLVIKVSDDNEKELPPAAKS